MSNDDQTSTLLFASPKRGGILQSSGFLDLQSLMSLSLTCKANAYDELSIIQVIENEVTRNHKCRTMKLAIDFWNKIHRKGSECSWLKMWLERQGTGVDDMTIQQSMLSLLSVAALRCYEVMLRKMLRAVPESERLRVVLLFGIKAEQNEF